MILFLDFDGVLHPELSGVEEFCCAPVLWAVLRDCPHVEVVFSTSWRESFPQQDLVRYATAGGGEDLASRFIGVTPIPEVARRSFVQYGLQPEPDSRRSRECEIEVWRHANNATQRPWVAVDDVAWWFSEDCPNLYLVNYKIGLQMADLATLIERLS